MASDALFQALAQAKAQPDRWARDVNEGANSGQKILGGYLQGKEIKQQLDQYRLLSTPLGSMYSDPSQIPFGLSPTHTVKDLLTLAPAMENYVPSSLISGAARSFGANVNDGSGTGGGGGAAPSAPPPPPTPAPLGGTTNPAPPPGTTALENIQGTGAGNQDNVPRGTPPAIVAPISTDTQTVNVPPGGMGMKGFQNIILPALKAGQERQQFGERENAEESRFNRTQANEDRRQQTGIGAANDRTTSGLRKEYETANSSTMSALDAYKQLDDAWKAIPQEQKGPGFGTAATHFGDIASGVFPKAVAYNKARLALAGAITAGIDPKGRQGPALLEKILQGIPTLGQSDSTRNDLMGTIKNQISSQANRNYEGFNSAAGSVGGSVPRPQIPTSISTGDSQADAAIQTIQSSALSPAAKAARVNAVLARVKGNRG